MTKKTGFKLNWSHGRRVAKDEAQAAYEWSKGTTKVTDQERESYRIGHEQGFLKALAWLCELGAIQYTYK